VVSEHLASQVVERRNGDSLEVVEIAAQVEKRHARIARRFQQIAFGILLKKRAVLPPAADSTTQMSMNFGDRLAARAYQLSAGGRHADGERLQQLIGQLEASHHAAALANTLSSRETEPEMSAVLVFLLCLADSDTDSLRDGNSCSGLVEIGSSVSMRRQQLAALSQPQQQHPLDSHIAPVYGGQGMVCGSSEGKAFMQYPSQLFSVAARPVGSGGKTRDGIGRCFPVFAPEDFRLPAAAWDRAAEGEEPVFRAVDDAIERRRNLPQSMEVGLALLTFKKRYNCPIDYVKKAGSGKLIRIQPGQQVTGRVLLDPLEKKMSCRPGPYLRK
jgi:hypothetical protein